MTGLLVAFCFVIGVVIGSFLNVVIWRVPRGESIVSPPSACPRCHTPISPRDNIPVLSWLLLRGRCRTCGEPISARYPAVELLTGVMFALMALRFDLTWQLPAYLYLAGVGVALAFIDLDTKRLPDVITLPSIVVALVLLALPALLDGAWDSWLRALLGGVALFAFYFLLAVIYPAGMGFGDVKLAATLGIYLAWLSWGILALGGFLGFLLGAVIGVLLMVLGRAGRKSKVPFGPFMIVGTWIAVLWGQPIVDWYAGILSG